MQRVSFLALAIVLLLAGIGTSLQQMSQRALMIETSQPLMIEAGDHLSGLGQRLDKTGWLPWPQPIFRLYGKLTANDGHIQAGEYLIQPGTTVPQLLRELRSGQVIQRSITFPEGWSLSEWLELLSKNDLITDNDYTKLQSKFTAMDWEGRLYPDTYSYVRGEAAASILARAKQQMEAELDRVWSERGPDTAVDSADDLLILASMIEKETGYEGDRKLIASVFANRLRLGMKLQSDPTVIYGLADFDGDLKRRHLSVRHEFNTYVIPRLPLGPICNPGRQSLLAAINPETSDFLYFVAKGDGRSHFSTSLTEHNRAVNRYQKAGRVENYQSAPQKRASEG